MSENYKFRRMFWGLLQNPNDKYEFFINLSKIVM